MIDHNARLSSGMKVVEAVTQASRWWNATGRHVVDPDFNRERLPGRVRSGGAAPGIVVPGEVLDVLPSGILRGLPWDMLTRQEQLSVVKAWHHQFVLMPQGDADHNAACDGSSSFLL